MLNRPDKLINVSLFAQGSNKNSIKTKASQKKHTDNTHTHTHTTQREHKNLKTRKNYTVKEFTNVVHISNLIFVADKVQVEIPYRPIDCRQQQTWTHALAFVDLLLYRSETLEQVPGYICARSKPWAILTATQYASVCGS